MPGQTFVLKQVTIDPSCLLKLLFFRPLHALLVSFTELKNSDHKMTISISCDE